MAGRPLLLRPVLMLIGVSCVVLNNEFEGLIIDDNISKGGLSCALVLHVDHAGFPISQLLKFLDEQVNQGCRI